MMAIVHHICHVYGMMVIVNHMMSVYVMAVIVNRMMACLCHDGDCASYDGMFTS